MHLLSVGSGQCALLRTPSGKTILFDAGTSSGFDAYEQVLGPFLRHQRLPAPTQAFISHANTDHYNALPHLLKKAKLERVYLNDYFGSVGGGPSSSESAVRELVNALREAKVEIVRLRPAQTIRLDDRTKVEVFWPPRGRRNDLSVNDTSLVLRVSCDGKSVLLTGDLDETGQAELTAAPERITADALVVPHHGGWEETLPEFVEGVDPQIVLVSNARELQGGPDAHRRSFYSHLRTNREYYSTTRNGCIRLSFGAGTIEVRTMR